MKVTGGQSLGTATQWESMTEDEEGYFPEGCVSIWGMCPSEAASKGQLYNGMAKLSHLKALSAECIRLSANASLH